MESTGGLSSFPLNLVAVAVGYLFSVIVGHVLIRVVLDPLGGGASTEAASSSPPALSGAQGFVERAIYTSFWYFGQPYLVVTWLVLKAVCQWRRWAEMRNHHAFLVGSGLSLLYGYFGARLLPWLLHGQYSSAIVYPCALVLGCLILRVWIGARAKGA